MGIGKISRRAITLLLGVCAALVSIGQGQTKPGNSTGTSAGQNPPMKLDQPQSQGSGKPTAAGSSAGEFSFDNFTQFSAIMTGGIAPSGDFTGHVYRSGNLMRMEGNAAGPNYFLTNLETQETHGYASTGCIDFERPYSRSFPFMLSGADKKYEVKPAGKETVDGHSCRVEDVTITSSKLPQPFTIRVWRADDLQGFPIKIENRRPGARTWTIHYTEVVVGPQDRSLFLIQNQCESYGLPDKNAKSPASEQKSTDDPDKQDEKSQPPDGKPQ
jgi:hypothetical protein